MTAGNDISSLSGSLIHSQAEYPNERQDRICIGFTICFLLLFTLGVARKQQDTVKKEISCTIQNMQALPEDYTLEEAIEEGYYYAKAPSEESLKTIERFLLYADGKGTGRFKKVMEVGEQLCFTYVYYSSKEYTVIQFLITEETNGYQLAEENYDHMVICWDEERDGYSYYLTDDDGLYEKNQAGGLTKEEIKKEEVYYLFSRDERR